MKRDISYITIDGRGENENFRDCITQAVERLEPNQGIHIIKDFEPFPMYKMMESKGFDKQVEKIGEEEYHVYFFPAEEISEKEADMKMSSPTLPKGHPLRTYIDETKEIEKVLSNMNEFSNKKFIKNQWLEAYDQLSEINTHFSRKQNQLFAALEKRGFDKPSKIMWTLDNEIRDIISRSKTLLKENKEEEFLKLQPEVIAMVSDMMTKEREILFPTAEELLTEADFIEMRKGDDEIGYCLIDNPPPYHGNIASNSNRGGTSSKYLGDTSSGDNHHRDTSSKGNHYGDTPSENTAFGNEPAAKAPAFKEELNNELLKDLAEVLKKHGVLSSGLDGEPLKVSQGSLTLNQINLIFKHLPIDLTYVDEKDTVKFYSDTRHRVFPRSPGVIGRAVQNCHPRESVGVVEKIIEAFRKGEQDEAEFWLEMEGKFIYILYTAVRDESGNFKGVLEMMQDATHIRSLTGSQRLLTWENNKNPSSTGNTSSSSSKEHEPSVEANKFGITKDTNMGSLLKKYPYLKDFLVSLSPKFEKLNSPMFKTMAGIATLNMISARGGFEVSDLINKISKEIDRRS